MPAYEWNFFDVNPPVHACAAMQVYLQEKEIHNGKFVSKFAENTMWIAGAMDHGGKASEKMWDDEDGFFCDVLRLPDGGAIRLTSTCRRNQA